MKYHFNAKKFKMIDSEQVCKGKVKSTAKQKGEIDSEILN